MKKLLLSALIGITLVTGVGCSNNEIKSQVEEVNKNKAIEQEVINSEIEEEQKEFEFKSNFTVDFDYMEFFDGKSEYIPEYRTVQNVNCKVITARIPYGDYNYALNTGLSSDCSPYVLTDCGIVYLGAVLGDDIEYKDYLFDNGYIAEGTEFTINYGIVEDSSKACYLGEDIYDNEYIYAFDIVIKE